jgi:hypothetical protein
MILHDGTNIFSWVPGEFPGQRPKPEFLKNNQASNLPSIAGSISNESVEPNHEEMNTFPTSLAVGSTGSGKYLPSQDWLSSLIFHANFWM